MHVNGRSTLILVLAHFCLIYSSAGSQQSSAPADLIRDQPLCVESANGDMAGGCFFLRNFDMQNTNGYDAGRRNFDPGGKAKKNQGPLMLQDVEFWGNCTRTEQEVTSRISAEGVLGLLVDGPKRVLMSQRNTVPVAGYFVRTLRDDIAIDQERQMLVAAVNLETNFLIAGLALDTGKMPAPTPPRPSKDPGEGVTLNLFKFDLRRAVNLSWQPGKYSVIVILREFLSNPVNIELAYDGASRAKTDSIKSPQGQEAAAAPDAAHLIYPLTNPAGGVTQQPDYRRRELSPPIPGKPGIDFRVDRTVHMEPGTACMLHGSFRLPVLSRERTEPSAGGSSQVTAIVPITLVVTGHDIPGPWIIRLQIPSYDQAVVRGPSAQATGYFSFDLLQLPEFPRRATTYFLSAFNGEFVTGPKPVTLTAGNSPR